MKKKLLFIALFSIGLLQAQNIFKDDFSTYTVGQELSGQGLWSNSPIAPNVGIGACLPISSMDPCTGTKIIAQPLSYLNYGSSPNSIEIAPIKDGAGRVLSPIVTNGDLYLGIVLNITTAPDAAGSPVDFLRVLNGSQFDVAFRLLVKNAGFGYNIGIRKGASNNATIYTTDLYNYGESVLVIIKYSHLDSFNDDIVKAYINPNYSNGEPLTPSAETANGFDQSGNIDRIAFRLNYNVSASMPSGFAGLVSTSSTWEGLTFEPLGVNQFDKNKLTISSSLENGLLNVSSANAIENANLNLYSMTGALLESQTITIPSGNSQITLASKLTTGIYIAQLSDDSGATKSFKILSK